MKRVRIPSISSASARSSPGPGGGPLDAAVRTGPGRTASVRRRHSGRPAADVPAEKGSRLGEAVALWRDGSAADHVFCYRELAIYYEHKARNLAEAKRITEEVWPWPWNGPRPRGSILKNGWPA